MLKKLQSFGLLSWDLDSEPSHLLISVVSPKSRGSSESVYRFQWLVHLASIQITFFGEDGRWTEKEDIFIWVLFHACVQKPCFDIQNASLPSIFCRCPNEHS
jgi:hypothetical protein